MLQCLHGSQGLVTLLTDTRNSHGKLNGISVQNNVGGSLELGNKYLLRTGSKSCIIIPNKGLNLLNDKPKIFLCIPLFRVHWGSSIPHTSLPTFCKTCYSAMNILIPFVSKSHGFYSEFRLCTDNSIRYL